jgi:hypothetical protein
MYPSVVLGGCPFVVGASGTVPVKDAVNLFKQMRVEMGIDHNALCNMADRYEELLRRRPPGHMNRVISSLEEGCS